LSPSCAVGACVCETVGAGFRYEPAAVPGLAVCGDVVRGVVEGIGEEDGRGEGAVGLGEAGVGDADAPAPAWAECTVAGCGADDDAEQPLTVSTARAAMPPPETTTVRIPRMTPRFPPDARFPYGWTGRTRVLVPSCVREGCSHTFNCRSATGWRDAVPVRRKAARAPRPTGPDLGR
jgi:hypothetical protein